MNPSNISPPSQSTNKNNSFPYSCYFFSFLLLPISLALVLYSLDSAGPTHGSPPQPRLTDGSILSSLEKVGSGQVTGPEDLVYDPVSNAFYTGCGDGSVKRLVVGDVDGHVEVDEVVNTGGRPLGLALSPTADGSELVIADAFKGLLKLTRKGELIELTKQAEGQDFKLTDGVDVAKDGTIYFTDASSKHALDSPTTMVEQQDEPNGRLLNFDPTTGQTRVLLRDLYFANGLAIAPDQGSLVFCETFLRMCKRYHITGTLAGSVEPFINNTHGLPDNIHYDGEGRYWIGIPSSLPGFMYKLMNIPLARKVVAVAEKYAGSQAFMRSAGVLVVDLEGNPVAHLYDRRLSAITSGVKVGQHLYMGSLFYGHILRLNLTKYEI